MLKKEKLCTRHPAMVYTSSLLLTITSARRMHTRAAGTTHLCVCVFVCGEKKIDNTGMVLLLSQAQDRCTCAVHLIHTPMLCTCS